MSKKRITLKIDPNLLIAIGVLIASFGTLIVSMKQASIMNEQTEVLLEQSKLNAWPSLSIEMHKGFQKNGINRFSVEISNRGTGPAIIEQTIIKYNGVSFKNWTEFYELLHAPDSIRTGHGNDILYNRIISPNEDFILVNWSFNKKLARFIYERANNFSVEICYKSVYGDLWNVCRNGLKSNLEKNQRKKIDACDASNEVLFEE